MLPTEALALFGRQVSASAGITAYGASLVGSASASSGGCERPCLPDFES